ncbi:hypothetical protein RclHR1_01750014 [Rhizophagus clarus]|uniref:Pentatricopeptide repeat-containing protein At5g02830, chloroplastic-like n=1 Tax=Rhizophagus clarus TaxID=94130 RepID=A0A2Z6QLK2_9GLOM|nr:hypothetical protein RclHR1_01750014 [Rhizophagus clarus]GET04483.1 pentatricopeptide repeat-containing protein At5g02830, chloroplastic-like [Rhizophagus clarus]
MHSLNIRNLNFFLFEFKTVQPIRQHMQYQSQILHTRQFNTANCRCYIETNSSGSNVVGSSFHSYYKQYQNTRNKRNSQISSYNSLPNKSAFIQALRKQLNEGVNVKPKIEEKIKKKSQKEVVKAIGLINDMITKDTINQLTSSHILSFYMKFNSLYSTKTFYLDLISYLLRQCSKHDRLDLVNVIFARFVYDVYISSRKHVLVALVIKVWNVMAKIYSDKGHHEEVVNIYKAMFQYGTFPNVKTYSTLIKSAAKANDPYKCFEFLEKIVSRGEKTNSATLNFLLKACLSSEDANIKENTNLIIELMSHWKIGPNGTTFIILLQHCENYEQLEDIWNKTLKYRLCKNKRLQEEIIKICCTKLPSNKSLIYDNMENMENGISKCFDYFLRFYRISKGEIPLGIYNTILKYCTMNGDIFRSMRILEMMWEKILEPKKSLYKNLFDSIHDNTVNNRIYTWRLIEGIFSKPKTDKLQKSLLNSMILTLGRLRDVRGIMEFYQSKIGLFNNNYHNSLNNIFTNRTDNIPMDIKLYNIFMKAVSECKYGPLSCVEIIKYTPIGLQLNHLSVKYLFSSIQTKKDIKLFGPILFEFVIKQEIILSKDVLEDIIRNAIRNISDTVGYRDIIIKYLVNEIISVQEGKDLLNCLNVLEMPR